jgi:F-type H+-transporting ATPase subunit gamma
MPTLRDIKRKISAVKKTKQITRAMNMVAASKLRTTQGKMENFAPYARKFTEVLQSLSSGLDREIHPLLVKREKVSKVELIHFTADRGLCGSFNVNSIARAQKWIKEQQALNMDCRLTTIGKKGRDYFRKQKISLTASHTGLYGTIDFSFVQKMAVGFMNRYMAGDVDEVYMMYAHFVSMAKQVPTLVKLIPIEPPEKKEGAGEEPEYLCEPSGEALLVELLPKHLGVQIFNAFLQQETSEHAARMAAMDNATKNCSEMVENLTLVYNKARQATITRELMDIVGGAEALR